MPEPVIILSEGTDVHDEKARAVGLLETHRVMLDNGHLLFMVHDERASRTSLKKHGCHVMRVVAQVKVTPTQSNAIKKHFA